MPELLLEIVGVAGACGPFDDEAEEFGVDVVIVKGFVGCGGEWGVEDDGGGVATKEPAEPFAEWIECEAVLVEAAGHGEELAQGDFAAWVVLPFGETMAVFIIQRANCAFIDGNA